MVETRLIHYDTARRELELASSIDEVKTIRDQAEAIRQYIKQQKGSLEMQNQAAEIKLRAERKAGQILSENEKNKGAATPRHRVVALSLPTYKDLDLEPRQAQRWQLEAEIPEEKFEQFIAETKAAADELTSKEALRIALKIRHENKTESTNIPNMPDGLFDVIVIDPPWPYGADYDPFNHRVSSPYKEQSIEDIMMLEIPHSDNCILWLWTTNKFMHDAFHILDTWGFEYKSILTWFKQQTGVGYWLRGQTEHCILSVTGKPQITHEAQGTALIEKATDHSAKPESFYQLVESLCPGRKLDIYSRKQREGWELYGDQIPE